MAQQTCQKCSRVNPSEAMYCFNDGSPLPNHSGGNGHGPRIPGFPTPFVFPSGQSCHTYDQLALACVDNWPTARDLLKQGYLERFFGGLGRADLAMAARNAAGFPDPDRGLDQLLGKLPAQSLKGPQVGVEPRQVNLGTLRVGTDSHLNLKVTNLGMGLLHGSVAVEGECPWINVGDAANSKQKLFQFLTEGTIPIHIRGQHLRAGNKPLEGKLTVDSNGGITTVTVTAAVPVTPFPAGSCLAGARTPREVASKAKANPKDAAQQFEKGTVGEWYKANGWPYPVQGASASGIAAVQQFFEALGLTPPPKVEVSDREINLKGNVGDPLGHTIKVSSQEKRPVYAHAACDQTWLQVTGTKFEGNSATIRLAVRAVPNSPGETLHATLTVTSNGNQKFVIPINLAVSGRARGGAVPVLEVVEAVGPTSVPVVPVTPVWSNPSVPVVQAVSAGPSRPRSNPDDALPVVAAVATSPMRPRSAPVMGDADPRRIRRQDEGGIGILPFVPIAFLMLGLLVTVGHDLLALGMGRGPVTSSGSGGPGIDPKDMPTVLALQFHDKDMDVSLGDGGVKPVGGGPGAQQQSAKWLASMRFGLTNAGGKKLTFEPTGTSNNTVLKIDGRETIFGEHHWQGPNGPVRAANIIGGEWEQRDVRLTGNRMGRPREGRESVWRYPDSKVFVTQTVELIPNLQSNTVDTCLVSYRIENKDRFAHTVGLRFMLDTYIGNNDGVPFLIEGQTALCNTEADLRGGQVPTFIQAWEFDDAKNRGTVCLLGLKLEKLEAPARVTLGCWPNPALANVMPGGPQVWRQEKAPWDVPVHSMQTTKERVGGPADSCVTMYWEPRQLGPGEVREVGFTYGLGMVSGEGDLSLTVTGNEFRPGKEFTVTALVKNPQLGETVTLELPPQFTLVKGNKTENVPPLRDASTRESPVTWTVRASSEGTYTVKVTSSTGKSQTRDVRISPHGIFD